MQFNFSENEIIFNHATVALLRRDAAKLEEENTFDADVVESLDHEDPGANEKKSVDKNVSVNNSEDDYVRDDNFATEETESPKYNRTSDNAAPKPTFRRFFSEKKEKNFLYHMNLAEKERKNYFIDNFPNKKFLHPLSSARAYSDEFLLVLFVGVTYRRLDDVTICNVL